MSVISNASSPQLDKKARYINTKTVKKSKTSEVTKSKITSIENVRDARRKIDFDLLNIIYKAKQSPSVNKLQLTTPNRNIVKNNGFRALHLHDKLACLGQGGYGTVLDAVFKGQNVAAKFIKLKSKIHSKSSAWMSVLREYHALGLTHQNIVKTFLVEQGHKYAIVISERISKTSLQSLIDKKCNLDFRQKVRIIEDICLAVKYCHDHEIIHLDVKPGNVLIDYYGRCKLTDFGNSILANGFGKLDHLMGTFVYMAPEILHRYLQLDDTCVASKACDVYSIGVTMWQLQTFQYPYTPLISDNYSLIYQIVHLNKRPRVPIINARLKAKQKYQMVKYQNLYQSCWKTNPEQRPRIETVIKKLEKTLELGSP